MTEQLDDPIDERLSVLTRRYAERAASNFDPQATASVAVDAPHRSRFRSLPVVIASGVLVVAGAASLTYFALGGSPLRPGSGLTKGTGTERLNLRDLSIDYPAGWSKITGPFLELHYKDVLATLGIGSWAMNCQPIQPSGDVVGGGECGADTWTVPPGGVVVQIYTWVGPGAVPHVKLPPTAISLPNGGTALAEEDATGSHWTIVTPDGTRTFHLEARYAAPNVETSRDDVRTLVQSIQWATPGV